MKTLFGCVMTFACLTIVGCGGSVDELPAGGGGPPVQTEEEIKKQIEISKQKSMGKYKGNPGADKK